MLDNQELSFRGTLAACAVPPPLLNARREAPSCQRTPAISLASLPSPEAVSSAPVVTANPRRTLSTTRPGRDVVRLVVASAVLHVFGLLLASYFVPEGERSSIEQAVEMELVVEAPEPVNTLSMGELQPEMEEIEEEVAPTLAPEIPVPAIVEPEAFSKVEEPSPAIDIQPPPYLDPPLRQQKNPLPLTPKPKAPAPVARNRTATQTPSPDSVGSTPTVAEYRSVVGARLREVKRYPERARARRASGTVVVTFSLDAGGGLASVQVTQSSGDLDLDAEALATVRRASPFPQPPSGSDRIFNVPLSFQVR